MSRNKFGTKFDILGWVAAEIWVFLYVHHILWSRKKGCNGNHENSCNTSAFIFEDNIFLRLIGPIEQIYIHNEMSNVFNVGLITPLGY